AGSRPCRLSVELMPHASCFAALCHLRMIISLGADWVDDIVREQQIQRGTHKEHHAQLIDIIELISLQCNSIFITPAPAPMVQTRGRQGPELHSWFSYPRRRRLVPRKPAAQRPESGRRSRSPRRRYPYLLPCADTEVCWWLS